MNNHRFILAPYKSPSSRHSCPSCGKHKQFTRYFDTETNEHLSSEVGKCNREIKCGYHYTPKQYFQDNPYLNNSDSSNKKITPHFLKGLSLKPTARHRESTQTTFIPLALFQQSLKSYDQNNFITFLNNLFGPSITSALISKYFIGTSKHWYGSTVFWQIDKDQNIRTGKIMLYNSTIGKRVKQPYNHITWVHTLLAKNCHPEQSDGSAFNIKQCLYGEHLLNDTTKPIAIVESEKTAIIASVYFPDFIWLACGSLTNFTKSKCQVLSGRKVILFPDLKCFEKWKHKASELSYITNFIVSDFLEANALTSEKQSGFDLADYLIRFSHNAFVNLSSTKPSSLVELVVAPAEPPPSYVEPVEATAPQSAPVVTLAKEVSVFNPPFPTALSNDWSQSISVLESFFTSIPLPKSPIQLSNSTSIINVSKFIDGHMASVKNNNGNSSFLPYLERLLSLKQILANS